MQSLPPSENLTICQPGLFGPAWFLIAPLAAVHRAMVAVSGATPGKPANAGVPCNSIRVPVFSVWVCMGNSLSALAIYSRLDPLSIGVLVIVNNEQESRYSGLHQPFCSGRQ